VDTVALAPFLDRNRTYAVAPSQRLYALLTALDRETHRFCRAGEAVENLVYPLLPGDPYHHTMGLNT
jgi:hypothetical protein